MTEITIHLIGDPDTRKIRKRISLILTAVHLALVLGWKPRSETVQRIRASVGRLSEPQPRPRQHLWIP